MRREWDVDALILLWTLRKADLALIGRGICRHDRIVARDNQLQRDVSRNSSRNIGLPARMFLVRPESARHTMEPCRPVTTARPVRDCAGRRHPGRHRNTINGVELLQLWDRMYLPPRVRTAWQPLIDSALAGVNRRPRASNSLVALV